MLKKSPGGSYFPYYYKGGEIHCLKYGSYYDDEASLFNVMRAEEAFVLSLNRAMPIWVDWYKTVISEAVLQEFVNSMERVQHRVSKLALVGLRYGDRVRVQRIQKRLGMQIPQIRFFRDPEDAKTWLIHEG